MDEIDKVIEKIDEGLNNLERKTVYTGLKYSNLVPFIKSNLKNYQKSHNPNYLKGLIDEFYKTSVASTEGSATYNEDIWNSNIEVSGKQTTLEDIFGELEGCYRIAYKN